MSVLGGSSGSSVLHQSGNRSSSTSNYTPQRGQVKRYGSRGGSSSILNAVKPRDAKKLTNEAVTLYTQALADDKNGNYNEAAVKLRKSLAIREFYWREQDKNIPVVLVKLADVLGKQKKYDEAVQNLDRSLAYCSRIFGPGTVERVPTLVLLGEIYQQKPDSVKSFESYKQAYTLLERAKGKSAQTTKIQISMAQVANKLGWKRTTCELYQEILDDHTRGIGGLSQKNLSSVAQDYSDVLRKDGREDEATAVLAKVGGVAITSTESATPQDVGSAPSAGESSSTSAGTPAAASK